MLHVLIERIRMSIKRFAGALKYEYAECVQNGFSRKNHDLSLIAPCSGKHAMRRLLTNLLGAAACFAVAVQPAFPGEDQPVTSEQTQTGPGTSVSQSPAENRAAVPEGASGMTVYVDPVTGAFLEKPAPGAVPFLLTPQIQNAFTTSHQGLVEVPSPVPGGGVKLDLQGRFQSPLVVTIDANGKVKMQHLGETTGLGGNK